jgi:hypothetical protein
MKALAATILSQRTETEQFFLEALNEVKEVIKQERKHKLTTIPPTNNNNNHHNNTGFLSTSMKGKATTTGGATTGGGGGGGTSFPPLNIKPSQMHLLETRRKVPDIPFHDLEKVTIADLNWEDKELVLRVLFAKMNGQGGQNPQNAVLARQRQTLGDTAIPQPVFISEGALQLEDNNNGQQSNIMNLQPFIVNNNNNNKNNNNNYSPSHDDDAHHSVISSLGGDGH